MLLVHGLDRLVGVVLGEGVGPLLVAVAGDLVLLSELHLLALEGHLDHLGVLGDQMHIRHWLRGDVLKTEEPIYIYEPELLQLVLGEAQFAGVEVRLGLEVGQRRAVLPRDVLVLKTVPVVTREKCPAAVLGLLVAEHLGGARRLLALDPVLVGLGTTAVLLHVAAVLRRVLLGAAQLRVVRRREVHLLLLDVVLLETHVAARVDVGALEHRLQDLLPLLLVAHLEHRAARARLHKELQHAVHVVATVQTHRLLALQRVVRLQLQESFN